ncbi:hypothetical protein EDB85DRAFT_2276782 [Lactarius pseudohatsudake]|nr:hypothetical protein EDB85DRAFT_2276782 [Lactarius pseudohatsudake]
MPALIPVDNTLGALFIGNVLSSILYGVTWLQVYSYYNSHCSRDRWPLKSFVAVLMLVDTANLVFNTYTTYHVGVTNFGDYRSNRFKSWASRSQPLFLKFLYSSMLFSWGTHGVTLAEEDVASTRIGSIVIHASPVGKGSRYLPVAIVLVSELSIAALSCSVICDILITFGMVYSLLSNRTQIRRTNNVLNLLAIYSINCGTLHLVFAVSSLTLLAKYRNTLLYAPSIFAMSRLYPCAFMSILNSRGNLRETLNGPEGVVATITQLKVRTTTTVVRDAQDTTGASTNTAVLKSLPPLSVSSDTSFSESVMAFDREKYPITL